MNIEINESNVVAYGAFVNSLIEFGLMMKKNSVKFPINLSYRSQKNIWFIIQVKAVDLLHKNIKLIGLHMTKIGFESL
jgi:hypothetical protein